MDIHTINDFLVQPALLAAALYLANRLDAQEARAKAMDPAALQQEEKELARLQQFAKKLEKWKRTFTFVVMSGKGYITSVKYSLCTKNN
jgi:hypothetical protein